MTGAVRAMLSRGKGGPAPQLADYLPHRSLLILLVVLGLVVAPHLFRLPLWESGAVLALIVWRGLASARQWQLPSAAFRAGLALGAFVLVYAGFGRVSGQDAGVALLVLMLCLKLTEMRSRRDVMIVMFLMYFLLLTHFLYSQELWTILYLLGSAVAITAVLIDAHHPGTVLPLRESARMAASMVGQALPLMVLFFVLFPRIPGPIWGLPNDAGPARSGLSDSMSPGDIASLVESDEPAFRVRFDGTPPPADLLYWRGPVFDFLDGRTWMPMVRAGDVPDPELRSVGTHRVRYEMTLEPMRTRWLFALDAPDPTQLPGGSRLDRTGTLRSDRPVTDRMVVRGTSATRYVLEPELSERERLRNVRIPAGYNPKTIALMQEWRARGFDDGRIVQEALAMFGKGFVYSLEAPLLGPQPVDEFLFATRRGFCEHYSAAFTFMMRAAGIPARVVTGYQGGTFNEIGGYYLVTQAEAHAWSEVWLPGRGWLRVDPTAAVAPGRIERGLSGAMSAAEGLPGYLSHRSSWRVFVAVRWDWINAKWNEWVLAYGPELQEQFLSHVGLADLGRMILALTVSVSLLLLAVGATAMRRAGPPPARERAVVLWQDAGRRLRRLGFVQRPDEGPRDFTLRVCEGEPQLSAPMHRVLDAYLRLRYAGERNPALESDFAGAVRLLRRT